jgi:aminoglycoside phosphotransferase family enzyme
MPHTLPAHLDALKQPEAHPEQSPVKLTQTPTSYLLRTGGVLYKIKKPGNDFSTLAVKEAFCHEEARLLKNFNPLWMILVVPVTQSGNEFAFGGAGEVIDHALKMTYLPDSGFLDKRLEKGALDAKYLEAVAEHLAGVHQAHPAKDRQGDSARPEKFRVLVEDMMYQMKRYYAPAFTQPILDMVRHPVDKFFEEQGKLFTKRRKGRVVMGHGAFLPEHIHIKDKQVSVVSPLEVHHKKYGDLDVSNDLATLAIALHHHKQPQAAEALIETYTHVTKDRDLAKMLPLYLTFQALKQGVNLCELKVALQQEELGVEAMDYFHLAVRFAREIPRT